MYTTLRPYATAGIALLGASAIAVAPVVATPQLADVRVAAPDVHLSAAIDPLTPLLNLFNNSEVNFAGLVNAWLEAPAPILQQIIANQISYVGQLPDIGAILAEMGTNARAALGAPFAEDLSSMNPDHAAIYELILHGIPGAIEPAPPQLVPLLKFTTTYLSGVLVGLAGLVMNPVLALGGGIHSVFQSLVGEDADLGAAINTLINLPTAVADAFLNGGQSMVITPLLTALGLDLPIPGMEVELAFGGLLSPGGSMFNSLNLVFGPGDVVPGQGAGLIGSLIALTKTIAKAIGWDGQGNPLAPSTEPALREATDTSLLASATVTLDTAAGTAPDATAGAGGLASTGGVDPEFAVVPAVSEVDDEDGDTATGDGDGVGAVEEETSVDDDTIAEDETAEDEAADDEAAEDEAADDEAAEDEAADDKTGADTDQAGDAADSAGGDDGASSAEGSGAGSDSSDSE
ncbi:hypothetical protein [Mycolicibacterium parafortuitum]|uniref:PE-PGRS family protein n=1 Tax=Mycolicibacterium parafortuitum TaxID=39692 RepID=A0A375YS56_MYCPF|nr:hypothetical protein [Mycolicibacterium parafortuitum]ORB28990.1 hypothetical protein BST38_17315 [Mycolicibacterium parafortuitum]SRX83936.1 hypothetical protein MPP7335_05721 [Mycolicibacterium parafortuitum]